MVVIESLLLILLNLPDESREPVRWIQVDVPEKRLTLYVDGEPLKTYPVAVGKPSSQTPIGSFRVATVVPNPSYHHPDVGTFGPGEKGNPVGTRWIGLNIKGYGIHGTNMPQSIGRAASRGCIRMRNSDVEELADLIQSGDAVTIQYQISETDPNYARKDIYKRSPQGPAIAAAR